MAQPRRQRASDPDTLIPADGKPKKYHELLAAALDFTEDDLDANRLGVISVRQHDRLAAQARRSVVRFGWVTGGVAILMLCFMVQAATIAYPIDFFVVLLWLSSLLLLLGLFMVHRRRRPLVADIRQARAASAEGRVTLNIEGGSGSTSYTLEIGGERFTITQQVLLALKNGDPYILYYLPNTHQVLSAEWLRGD